MKHLLMSCILVTIASSTGRADTTTDCAQGKEIELQITACSVLIEQNPRNATAFYNRGVVNSVVIAEAIRNAQKITGKKDITGEEMRRGLESLQITAARWKEIGLEGFATPMSVSCTDHNGHASAYVQQWDGAKWVKISDWIAPMKDKVDPLIDAAAADYVTKNQPWPKRTEACDKSS